MRKIDYKFKDDKGQHLHTLDGKPLKGATSIMGKVMPPPLAFYGSGMACKSLGWYDRKPGRSNYLPDDEGMPALEERFEEIQGMTPEQYLKALDEAYMAHYTHMKERGKEGTETHDKVEDAIKEAIAENDGYLLDEYEDPEIEEFAKWGRGKRFIHSEVHACSRDIWTGGITDMVYEDDGIYIGDIKTGKGFYPSQFFQEGFYDFMQRENGFMDADGNHLGDPVDVKGYTIVNLREMKKGFDVRAISHYQPEVLREFAVNLTLNYEIMQDLEEYIKGQKTKLK